MPELPPVTLALLQHIATPEVNGVPGALDSNEVSPADIGPLLLASLVSISAVNPVGDPRFAAGDVRVTYAHACVAITDQGRAVLAGL